MEWDYGWIERIWGRWMLRWRDVPCGGGLRVYVERALEIIWLMVTTGAGSCCDGCVCTEGSAARELVECAGKIGRGRDGLLRVLIEEMSDAWLPG